MLCLKLCLPFKPASSLACLDVRYQIVFFFVYRGAASLVIYIYIYIYILYIYGYQPEYKDPIKSLAVGLVIFL